MQQLPKSGSKDITYHGLESLEVLQSLQAGRMLARWVGGIGIFLFLVLFLPWQQNIDATGEVTALSPRNRPQTIQSAIPGRIDRWYVQEGDYVQTGDTILNIQEIKDKYFDPELLVRLQEQLNAKQSSIGSKEQKAQALRRQIAALRENLRLKLKQTKNKVRQTEFKLLSDSMAYVAEQQSYRIANNQLERQQTLYDEGLKSLTEFQEKQQKQQQTQAKLASTENKFLATENELINAQIELNSVEADYLEKISKAESDLNTTLAELYDSQGSLSKLRNEYANMRIRHEQYYMVAPQDGYVVRALKTGIGETIKEGEGVVTVMPENPDKAIELYVRPMDVPLLSVGRPVRLEFDGWPALQFSGWPSVAVGTFGGVIQVIDYVETASQQGKYRILIVPNPNEDGNWPDQLRLGSEAKGFIMLEEVPLWYELWRLYNGFPPSLKNAPGSGSKYQEKKASA